MSKKEANHSKKGKSVAAKMPQMTLPKSSREAKILEEFLKNALNAIPTLKLREVPSESVRCSEQGSESPHEFYHPSMGAGIMAI
ncbi:hypothetical protein ACOSP7_028508 [Xanthoceras sorbifolium]